MPARTNDEKGVYLSVRLSVRPSFCQTRALWQNGRKICPDFYTMPKIIQPSFFAKKNGWCGRPILPEILGQRARVGAKSPILNRSHQSKARVSNREREGQVGLLHIFMKTFSNCNGESSRICRILHLFLSTSSHNIIDVDTMLNYHS